jgi:transcriptional regulator with XRE-family HTH domain
VTGGTLTIDYAEIAQGHGVQLGDRLGRLITDLRLTQNEVARRMSLNSSIINLWTAGKRPVPARRLPGLAGALGVSVDELLDGRTLERSVTAQICAELRPINCLPDTPRPLVEAQVPVCWDLELKCLLCGRSKPRADDPTRCSSCGSRAMVRDAA